MIDSPLQTVLQQRDAKPIPGEHLEVLGKRAATEWVMGKVASLHEAVVQAVKSEHLAPEQVRRVVEFANQDAYSQEFRKEGQDKVVHFDCGPADPAHVLQDLNDGGGGSLYDQGNLDYRMTPSMAKAASIQRSSPTSMDKTASVDESPAVPGLTKLPRLPGLPKVAEAYEDQLWGLFQGDAPSVLPMSEPLRPLMDVRHKLASVRDELVDAVNCLELEYTAAGDALYHQVKQAALDGTSLGDMVAAWSEVNPDPLYVKVAFQLLSPQLRKDGVYSSLDAIGASLEKHASSGEVDPTHPLVTGYADFVDVLSKLATARALMEEYSDGFNQADLLLKQAASGGVVGAIGKGFSAANKGINAAAKPVAHVLVGSKDAKKLAPVLATGAKAIGAGGALLAGNAAIQNVTDRPGPRAVVQQVKKVVPGTMEYQERRYRNQMGM